MLSSKLGHFLDKPLFPFISVVKIRPDVYTIIGLILNLFSAWIVIFDLFWGGILLGIASIFDILDGVSARYYGTSSKFGAFLDSFFDRISEGFFFAGLTLNFTLRNDIKGVLLSLIALILSYLISYARARAEGLGLNCKVGIIERPERIILLLLGLLTEMPHLFLFILCILSFFTVAQRFYHTYLLCKK